LAFIVALLDGVAVHRTGQAPGWYLDRDHPVSVSGLCEVYVADMRVKVSPTSLYTYSGG
jgi:hypothetical protein